MTTITDPKAHGHGVQWLLIKQLKVLWDYLFPKNHLLNVPIKLRTNIT